MGDDPCQPIRLFEPPEAFREVVAVIHLAFLLRGGEEVVWGLENHGVGKRMEELSCHPSNLDVHQQMNG